MSTQECDEAWQNRVRRAVTGNHYWSRGRYSLTFSLLSWRIGFDIAPYRPLGPGYAVLFYLGPIGFWVRL